MLSFALPLFLAFPVVSPNVPLPAELEVCILTAEVCSLEHSAQYCGDHIKETNQQCIADYEDCSYAMPEAHAPACRLDYVWCKLEAFAGSDPAYLAFCDEVYATCPSQA